MRKGRIAIEADMFLYGKKRPMEAYHEILTALRDMKISTSIRLNVEDLSMRMEEGHRAEQPEEEEMVVEK